MKKYFGVSLNIILLGIVSLLNDLSSEMIMPILPLFFYDLGASSLIVGLLGGLRESISSEEMKKNRENLADLKFQQNFFE